jgi:two-component system cell cycle sensor histidine kinase/response regulator CckA
MTDVLAIVFERAPVHLALLDHGGTILLANRLFRATFGEACVGASGGDLVESASAGLASFVRRLVAKRASFRVDDLLIRAAHGEDLRVEAHGDVLAPGGAGSDSVERAEEFVLALVDQTERVTAATARAQRERSETIARFAGGLSHDMNNMLSTIVSTAQAGAQDTAEGVGDAAKDFRSIIDFAERGAALARSLRSIAFDETGSWRPVDLAEEIRAIAAVLGRGSSGVPIVLDLDDGVAEVVGDRARLHQLVLNLMVNARDATRAHGGGIEVELKRTLAGGVRFTVADSGPGVAPELRAQIFEPYFSTKTQESEDFDGLGTGLGLAIVDAVVRSTGAAISVESSRTGGALFTVEWPVTAVMRADPVRDLTRETPLAPAAVLLADDESALVGAVARQLRRAGHSVYAAMSAAECRRIFSAHAELLDVAVIDVRLGDGDGRHLAAEFLDSRPDLGIVLVSASGARGFADSMPSVQALAKPFDFKELTRAIQQARRRRVP